jgi:hypothetical protein
MLREKLHEYFSFTKKERIGVLTLVALIIIVFILPYFFSSKKTKTISGSLSNSGMRLHS